MPGSNDLVNKNQADQKKELDSQDFSRDLTSLDKPVYSKESSSKSGNEVKPDQDKKLNVIEPNKDLTIRSDEQIEGSRASLENLGLKVPWRHGGGGKNEEVRIKNEPPKADKNDSAKEKKPPKVAAQMLEPDQKIIEPQKKKALDTPLYSTDTEEEEKKDYLDIVILEDNFYIRFVLQHLVAYLMKHAKKDYRLYTSEEGIQGLGYVMVTVPDIIIIDATLPKYSGKEVVEFLLSNTRLMSLGVDVLILKDCEDFTASSDDSNVVTINKCDKTFISTFIEYLDNALLEGQSLQIAPGYHSVLKASSRLVSAAVKLDASASKIIAIAPLFKVIRSLRWLLQFFAINRNMIWLYLLAPRVIDDNVEQERKDLSRYRIRSYSALMVTILAIGFLVVQLVLLWIGKGFFKF